MQFGHRDPGASYSFRPSAYALVLDRHLVAVVRTPLGLFLPGGGQIPGETPAETVRREALEECGLDLRVGDVLLTATEFLYSSAERTHFQKSCTFLSASVIGRGAPSEHDHTLDWLPASAAVAQLASQCHAWAVATTTGIPVSR